MAPNQSITLTAREMEVLALAWQCMETQPKIDINKLAALTSYKTSSAGVIFNNIKKKIRQLADSVTGMPTLPSTPSKTNKAATPTSTSRKRKNAAAAAAGASAGTPSKKAKKCSQDEMEEEPDDDDNGEEQLFGNTIAVKKEEDIEEFGRENDIVFLS